MKRIRKWLGKIGIQTISRKQAFLNAYHLLLNPVSYTTYSFARNADGKAVNSDDPKATSWCSLGAIKREVEPFFTSFRGLDFSDHLVKDLLQEAYQKYPYYKGKNLVGIHDELNRKEVLDIWKAVGQKHGWLE